MRAGGCTVQQALTAEAAGVVKQAVALARRRGHAQVTPLHVANTMLSTSTGLLRTACLQSRSHPLQCRALELCFNVALNRLPASTGSPMMGSHHHHQQHHPSISNALVAAFKRAQAHQRRGSVENQQQPLLAVKIELEQLIISILDDPSVSRVMREAGFSSTQVKINVEQAVSLEICNDTTPDPTKNDDVMFVIENMVKKKTKSAVIVGESLGHVEGVARGVVDKIEKGEAVRGAKCVNLTLASFARLTRDEVERKVEELERLVKNYMTSGGAVLFLGELKWTAEYRSSTGSTDRRINHYCPVEHVVIEIGKLVTRIGEHDRFWLIGIATFETYKICKSGHFSLESVWGLNPITIPSNSLRLSLVPVPDSDEQSRYSSKKGENGCGWLQVELGGQNGDVEAEKELNCCGECSAKFESEARSLRSRTSSGSPSGYEQSTSNLPAWLQHYKNQNKPSSTTSIDQECVTIKDLGKKWSSICSTIHRHHHQQQYSSEKTLNFSSIISPSSTSTSSFSYNPYPALHRNMSWPQHHHHHFSATPETVNLSPNSASSSDVMEVEYVTKFKELNADNLKTLCGALEHAAPYHAHLAPDIAAAILRCRSGMARRKEKRVIQKEDTWLFFQGADVAAKEAVARELARLVFGSHASCVSIALSSFSPSDRGNKRSRDDQRCSYVERFAEAVAENPHRVFLVEDVEQADWRSQVGLRRAVESGQVAGSSLGDAIVILTCERFISRSRAGSPSSSDREKSPCGVSLDLNMSIDGGDGVEECCEFDRSGDEIGLLEAVDAMVIFKFQDL